MARWRLTAPHYLNVPDTYWEQLEVSRETGRQKRMQYKVPLYLDPANKADWTHKDGDDGEIIVAHEGSAQRRDIIFVGDPTMDMEPLDDEAEKLSAIVAKKGQHPIDSLPGQGDYSSALLDNFTKQLDAVIQKLGGIPKGEATPNMAVPSNDQMVALQQQMNAVMEKNAELERRLAQMEHADDNEPLPETTEPTAAEIAASAQAAANQVSRRA